eukprot:GHVO01033972.1.p1 GENE.GHVO01033972.1~~GHVO01033972.1.p1  ORF type:complete len:915 (+),score=194.31 GHVO01033972.1:159-2747(+)
MDKVAIAQQKFMLLGQDEVDHIFSEVALETGKHRLDLARKAVEETGIGNIEDKTIKNHLASEYVFNQYKDTKTCGVIERDVPNGFTRVAEPIGVLAGIVPTTNPTSTTLFKGMLALKTRNCIVFSPHPRAAKCTIAAARLLRDVAVAAGAPADCIAWIDKPTVPLCNELMRHPKTQMIVATGAGGLVKAAYSSGKPAMGGGAGNTPVIVDETADVEMAVNSIILSKTFDNGVICASEQCVICLKEVEEEIRTEFFKRGAHFLDENDKKLVGDYILSDEGVLNPAAVGQTAYKVAEGAGCLNVPQSTRLLLAEISSIGPEEKLSHEKLCPCLGFMSVNTYDEALDKALELVRYGGMGHTSVLYTDLYDEKSKNERVSKFQLKMPTGRIMVGTPTSHGAVADVFNPRTVFSLSLGCGSWGMNATAEGLQVKHLLNYKSVTERRPHMLWFKVPNSIYFNRGSVVEALKDLKNDGHKKALIVTDHQMKILGVIRRVVDALEDNNIDVDVFTDITSVPNSESIEAGVKHLKAFKPDCIVAVGGGSAMDAAKLMRLKYEHPTLQLTQFASRFMDLRKRVVSVPNLGSKVKKVVCIPTTSGTGAEMTPYALYCDTKKNSTFPITDYSLSPDIVIIDSELAATMPKPLVISSGSLALSHAIESYVSMFSSDYTQGLSMKSVKLIIENITESALDAHMPAREHVHNATAIGAMAVANAFVGIAEALGAQLLGNFGVPWGIAQFMVICQVIKFNAEDAPKKLGTFSQYTRPKAKEQYAELVDYLRLCPFDTPLDTKVDKLIDTLQELKKTLGIPASLKEYGVAREEFDKRVEAMSFAGFDDQCTSTNPRYPLISEMRTLLEYAYEGTVASIR